MKCPVSTRQGTTGNGSAKEYGPQPHCDRQQGKGDCQLFRLLLWRRELRIGFCDVKQSLVWISLIWAGHYQSCKAYDAGLLNCML